MRHSNSPDQREFTRFVKETEPPLSYALSAAYGIETRGEPSGGSTREESACRRPVALVAGEGVSEVEFFPARLDGEKSNESNEGKRHDPASRPDRDADAEQDHRRVHWMPDEAVGPAHDQIGCTIGKWGRCQPSSEIHRGPQSQCNSCRHESHADGAHQIGGYPPRITWVEDHDGEQSKLDGNEDPRDSCVALCVVCSVSDGKNLQCSDGLER
jgi:hypothetical protein